ncbi:unnamed protein product [Malus baccata var. baccata]
MRVMAEVHEGICEADQAGMKMKWLLRRGWAMDFIRQIYPASSKGHTFIIVATDYFTKWVEALAVKTITSTAVKKFIEIKILHRQDAVLLMEINVSSVRIQNQFGLHCEEYIEAMCQGIEDLDVARIEVLNQIQEWKRAVGRAYNKKVKLKSFKEGDLVWKVVLPLGAPLRGFGKWSLTWEGPFVVSQVLDKG